MIDVPDFAEMNRLLGERAASDSELDRYRVDGEDRWLDVVPDGWFVSEAVEHIAVHGGWFPGIWEPNFAADDVGASVVELLVGEEGLADGVELEVQWLYLGRIWEQDLFFTPLTRERVPSAPLLGWSIQAQWMSMVFPSEAALLEAFIINYDILGTDPKPGSDGRGGINPFFVEWVTKRPVGANGADVSAEVAVHERLVEVSSAWTSNHRCWSNADFPVMDSSIWSAQVCSRLLGVNENDL